VKCPGAILLALVAVVSRDAAAQNVDVIRHLSPIAPVAPFPRGDSRTLVSGPDGNLYGVGGETVFKMTATGEVTLLHIFQRDVDGDTLNGLTLASDGRFYGTTYGGGPDFGRGTVFRIAADGTYTLLHTFRGTDGASPIGNLIQAADGNLYGMTDSGEGAATVGTFFKIALNGSFTLLHVMTEASHPTALLLGSDGVFYGMSSAPNSGVVFSATSAGVVTIRYRFMNSGVDGSPFGPLLIEGSDGNLYGTSQRFSNTLLRSVGIIFRVKKDGTGFTVVRALEQTVHTLLLASDGVFYGTTYDTGAGAAFAFSVSAGGTVTTLHTFDTQVQGSLLLQNAGGVFYGAAGNTLFTMTPQGTYTALPQAFAWEGSAPIAVLSARDGTLYTTAGRSIFRMTTAGAGRVVLHTSPADEDGPGPLVQPADGNFYGTGDGGANTDGRAFRMTADGTVTTIHSFRLFGTDGSPPSRLISASDGTMYGTTSSGSVFGRGALFRMSTDGTLSVRHAFDFGEGSPNGGLAEQTDGTIYGTTAANLDFRGSIFRVTASGSFSTVYTFHGTDGSDPIAIVAGTGGEIYGVTAAGGASGFGTVFRLSAAGVLTTLHSFSGGSDGRTPIAALVRHTSGNFYGLTSDRAAPAPDQGTLFEMKPGGTFTTLQRFAGGAEGGFPTALVQGGDARIYGTAAEGGRLGGGTIFRISVDTTTSPVPPQIAVHPSSQSVAPGATATFVAAATGSPAPAVQWQVSTNDGSTFTNVTAAVSATYSFAAAPGDSGKQFRAVFTNSAGSATTNAARLTVTSAISAPFGSFDTPASTTTPQQGSIAVTGWALDNVGVSRVEIWRDLQPGEPTVPFAGSPSDPRNGKVFIANATFVEGARPDVEALYRTLPLASRAGWGYLMLTWGLWNQGNGTYSFHAYAFDGDANVTTLGQKTLAISNNTATKPFGSIDTPSIGGTASGIVANYGWALTPKVNGVATCKIPSTGVQVSIDSGQLQPVAFGDPRPDIAAGFPGFSNTSAAGGHFIFDWSTLTNGPHTIGWVVTDDCGRADGIGSRYFTVTNGTSALTSSSLVASGFSRNEFPLKAEATPTDSVASGFSRKEDVLVKQGERLELPLPRGFDTAYQLVGDDVRPLPIGSTFDPIASVFYWQPAPAFLGTYRFVFSDGRASVTVRVIVR